VSGGVCREQGCAEDRRQRDKQPLRGLARD